MVKEYTYTNVAYSEHVAAYNPQERGKRTDLLRYRKLAIRERESIFSNPGIILTWMDATDTVLLGWKYWDGIHESKYLVEVSGIL